MARAPVDTINDGNGEMLVDAGEDFDYAFTVRNRAAMYWYHPHPHGATAAQANRGLFGILMVEDDDEAALRNALALVPGETEIPLVLHDRRAAAPRGTRRPPDDMLHGWYGDEALVNFTPRALPRRRGASLPFPRVERVQRPRLSPRACGTTAARPCPSR